MLLFIFRIYSLLFPVLLFLASTATGMEKALQKLLASEGMEHVAIGISVKNAKTGAEVLDYRGEMALTPASVTKLLSTWLALQKKGTDFRYKTSVFYSGQKDKGVLNGDLVVRASGDPTPESRYFPSQHLLEPVVEALRQAGISRIRGRILVEPVRPGTGVPGSWVWEDISNYYAALALPFNYRDNTYVLEFATEGAGMPARLEKITPPLPELRLINEVRAAEGNRDNAWIFGGPYSGVLCVKGTIPAFRSAFRVKGAMHRPDLFFIRELTVLLEEKGITLENLVLPGQPEYLLFELFSPSLKEIVRRTNKSSVNLFAEAAGRLVAAEEWAAGAEALLHMAGVPARGMILKDACGLSPLNAVPAQVFTDLLVVAARQQDTAFISSLPLAGTDSGLAPYLRFAPSLRGRVQAKTGSMSGVRGLSGYLHTRSGELLAFTILINHYTCPTIRLQQVVSLFLETLMKENE